MELRQLAYFLAVAEERNFTRAAQRIPIAQPAISQQVRRLEAELGERLFVRDRRGIRLTAAGEALLPHARAMLADAEHAREAVAALRGLLTGRLAFGFVLPLPDQRLPGLVGAFHRQYPGIELKLIEDETDALLAALATGQLDAALVGLGRYDRPPPDVESLLVAREPVVVAVDPRHPLAGAGSIPLHALRDEPMIAFTSASKQRSTLEAACHAAGFAPRVVAETSDLGVVIDLVQHRIGVAVLPRSALDGADTVARLRLTRPKLDRRILLVWRPGGGPPAARAFLALARHHLVGGGGGRAVAAPAPQSAARRAASNGSRSKMNRL
jgi:DNA-binding transcriptional LysR family regulator